MWNEVWTIPRLILDARERWMFDCRLWGGRAGTVWELWSSRVAHEGLHPAQICVGVCDPAVRLRPAWDETVPPPLRALAEACWATDPAARCRAPWRRSLPLKITPT